VKNKGRVGDDYDQNYKNHCYYMLVVLVVTIYFIKRKIRSNFSSALKEKVQQKLFNNFIFKGILEIVALMTISKKGRV